MPTRRYWSLHNARWQAAGSMQRVRWAALRCAVLRSAVHRSVLRTQWSRQPRRQGMCRTHTMSAASSSLPPSTLSGLTSQ